MRTANNPLGAALVGEHGAGILEIEMLKAALESLQRLRQMLRRTLPFAMGPAPASLRSIPSLRPSL